MFFLTRTIGLAHGELDFLTITCVSISWTTLRSSSAEPVGHALEAVWWVLNHLCLSRAVLKLSTLDLHHSLKMLFGTYKEDLKFSGSHLKSSLELPCNTNLINNQEHLWSERSYFPEKYLIPLFLSSYPPFVSSYPIVFALLLNYSAHSPLKK